MTAIQALRKEVKHYVDSADEKALRMVKAILEIEREEDEDTEDGEVDWDDLPEELQTILDRAIKESDEGKGTPHEQVMEKYSKWFKR